ncbi:hypothetical protein K1Y77_17255 (plasmid) [Halomonas qaidamensis]|uniref:Tip attachment protein J domain-containing protein n=1 Tax=Halomonas qaidamensis TaxID=2866211 RepID=A0ABY6JUB3_9GAMM|nr:hypothetical protein [Halomonas qaidamensis]UYV20909.1 hypothetical protein K1Y77_17255 [Halomonas qaidamensis]
MIWLLRIDDALDDAGATVTLRFASGEYRDPDGYGWRVGIQQAGLYRAGLFAGDIIRNASRSGYGETTLINVDGRFDYLADVAMDGRVAVLSLATDDGVEEAWRGTVSRVGFERGIVSITLRDPIELLQLPHPNTRYAGTNVAPDGLEGTDDDIGGTVKPRLYGQTRNAAPVLVNEQKLIYQISDIDCTVIAVYDNGVRLDFAGTYDSAEDLENEGPLPGFWEDWQPPRGKWRRYQGYIRLGTPPSGQLTVAANGAQQLAGDVMAAIASDAGQTLHSDDVATLNALGQLRMLVTDETSTADLLDRIAVSVGGYWRIDATGTIRAGVIEPPTAPVLTLRKHQILQITREATGAGDNGLPVGAVVVEADPIEVTQTDLAGAVTEGRRARLEKAVREAVATSTATQARHPLAGELRISSRLATRAEGKAVADRVLALTSVRRDSVTVEARVTSAAGLRIGKGLRLETPRLGYSAGRNFLIVGREIDASNNRLTLTLWG